MEGLFHQHQCPKLQVTLCQNPSIQDHGLKYLISSVQEFFSKGLMLWRQRKVKLFASLNHPFIFFLSHSVFEYLYVCEFMQRHARTCLECAYHSEKTPRSQKEPLQAFTGCVTTCLSEMASLFGNQGKNTSLKGLFKVSEL